MFLVFKAINLTCTKCGFERYKKLVLSSKIQCYIYLCLKIVVMKNGPFLNPECIIHFLLECQYSTD